MTKHTINTQIYAILAFLLIYVRKISTYSLVTYHTSALFLKKVCNLTANTLNSKDKKKPLNQGLLGKQIYELVVWTQHLLVVEWIIRQDFQFFKFILKITQFFSLICDLLQIIHSIIVSDGILQ